MNDDGDGKISCFEFLTFVLVENGVVEMKNISNAMENFRQIDVSRTGFIEERDLEMWINGQSGAGGAHGAADSARYEAKKLDDEEAPKTPSSTRDGRDHPPAANGSATPSAAVTPPDSRCLEFELGFLPRQFPKLPPNFESLVLGCIDGDVCE